ncbi:MAG: hypothetical protein P8H05_02085 [Schleiferiaceae bacterium]|nr:hypothetical protein [Schleiferiaceae bacterium]
MKLKFFKWNSLSFLSGTLFSWIIPLSQNAHVIARGIILDWSIIILVHAAALFGFSKLFSSENSLGK